MSDKKIELIAQLLAKAESTTPAEAEALMEHAERLMTKYMIDQSVIDERRAKQGKSSEKIVEERLHFTGAYRGEMLHLCSVVIGALGTLKGLQYTGGTGKTFTFWIIGFESDVQQAKVLIESLQLQAAVAVRAWWKENKAVYTGDSAYVQEKARRSFVHGFGTGAALRLRESRQQVLNEEQSTAGTEMVLVSRKAKVDEYFSGIPTKRVRGRGATGRDGAAADGIAKGKQANTGEKSVTRGRGISA